MSPPFVKINPMNEQIKMYHLLPNIWVLWPPPDVPIFRQRAFFAALDTTMLDFCLGGIDVSFE